ncbi:choice-of-anchor Q domain-containing protein [uncultured Tenacibaculum sp.]|uniref:InlB B-repeat-containing protein n=1 Tax=uncultured Tenacibaculum sp. TaxID=174713 RepID=UPI0026395771|nr:choice-of-anchor Q domain-containing protein [uncultured Tenacibaculum sp.]
MKTKLFLIILFLTTVIYAQVPTTDLVKSYEFTNGSLVNIATPGTGDLAPTGTARTQITDFLDRSNQAYILNGDSFNAGQRGAAALANTGDVTIGFWIKTGTINSTPQSIIKQSGVWFTGIVGWDVELVNGKVRLTSNFLKNGSQPTLRREYESNVIADSKWHHVNITLKKVTFLSGGSSTFGLHRYIYIDNELQADGKSGGAAGLAHVAVNSPSDIIIADGTTNKYEDTIDNIRIYNKALDDVERKNLYKEFYDLVPRFYVDLNASGANNSTSWANGFTDLSKALSVVTTQDIWVKAGTYKPHATDRTISFTLNQEDLNIYGGFNGTETTLSQRDVNTYKTILSGDLQGNDTAGTVDYNLAEKSDNSLHVVVVSKDNISIDGLTIINGFANGTAGHANGAAILKHDTGNDNLTIKNCSIKDNISYGGGAVNADFRNTTNSTFNIENTIFDNNLARWAAALYSYTGINNASADANVINCLFTNNVTKDLNSSAKALSASAMWFRAYRDGSSYTLDVVNCTFSKNQDIGSQGSNTRATFGLSRHFNAALSANISNSIFYGNTTVGGALINSIGRIDINLSDAQIINALNSIDEDNFAKASTKTNTSTANPLFNNAAANDFRLQITSPGKDAGNNTKIPVGITADLLGNQRIYNTTVDMGAYEFDPALVIQYNLTINKTGSGSVVPNGTSTHNNGDVVTLIATPISGWNFAGWSGDASGTTNPLQVTMNADKNITATFNSAPQTLTINTVGSGSVTESPIPTNGGGYNFGDLVTLTATPAAGYKFDGWSGAITSTNNPETITMNGSKNLTATFSLKPVIYVDKDATGANDGSSWTNAYTNLQTALTNVTANSDIWIADGTYKRHTTDRFLSFIVNTTNIGIYGGFNGTETTISQRDFRTNKTILSGDLQGNDTGVVDYNLAEKNDNTTHILRVISDDLILDGITISGGYASLTSPAIESDGAAILKADAVNNLTIKNCNIKDNISFERGNVLAVFNGNGKLTIENTVFDNNLAMYGSGIYSFNANSTSITANITNCLFSNNISKDRGGIQGFAGSAMWLRAYGTNSTYNVNIANSTFAKNQDITARTGLVLATVGLSQRNGHGVMTATVSNSVLYGNTMNDPNLVPTSIGWVNSNRPSDISVINSITQGGSLLATSVTNVIYSDPLFTDAVNNDFTLQSGSPAVDAGDNAKIPSGITTDLQGNQRIFNTTVDMGAYEYGTLPIVTTWTGATDNDWNTSSNWDNGVPIATMDAVIPNVSNDPQIRNTNLIASVKNLEIQPGGSLKVFRSNAITIEGDLVQNGTFEILSFPTTSGSLIVKGSQSGSQKISYYRGLSANWHLVSSPVVGQSIAISGLGSIATSGVKHAIAYYNNNLASSRYTYYTTASGSNNINTAGNFIKGKGYSVRRLFPAPIILSGTLNTSDVSIVVTDASATGNKWNLIGNPFTASIQGNVNAEVTNNFLTVNASQLDPARVAMYVWNASTGSYDIINQASVAKHIAPGQGFFVEAKNGGGTVQFTEAMQSHQTGNIFSKGSAYKKPSIKITVSEGKNTKSTEIKYLDNTSIGLDLGYDAGVFSGENSEFGVYTHLVDGSKDVDFALQCLPKSNYEEMVIPLGIKTKGEGKVVLSAKALNLPNNVNVYLEDRDNNTFVKLNGIATTYKLPMISSKDEVGRFYIHTTAKSKLELTNIAIESENINMYMMTGNTLKITGVTKGETKILVFDILGKEVFNTTFKAKGTNNIELSSLKTGVYIVRLKTADGANVNRKIIIE